MPSSPALNRATKIRLMHGTICILCLTPRTGPPKHLPKGAIRYKRLKRWICNECRSYFS
jgi:hypothetical protein